MMSRDIVGVVARQGSNGSLISLKIHLALSLIRVLGLIGLSPRSRWARRTARLRSHLIFFCNVFRTFFSQGNYGQKKIIIT